MPRPDLTDEATYEEARAAQRARADRPGNLSRRQTLGLLASVPFFAAAGRIGGRPGARPVPVTDAGIRKPLPPEWFVRHGSNAEMRWDSLADLGFLVPNERFFVRNHTATPEIDASTWRLRLVGDGLRGSEPVELTYEELLAMPARTTTELIECAGNGRRFFADQQGTPTEGTQWGLGAVGAARWRGVPLAHVLDRAGLLPTAVDVMPQGLDAPVVRDGVDHGHVRRPLPIEKALDDVLLAYEMNGQPLPPDHGFPVRLVVPGWVGIASVKWLGQIEVSQRPLLSPWNTTWYRFTGPAYPPDIPPLSQQPVKSALELPWAARLPAHRSTVLRGRSWSGGAPIREVEVSLDGGGRWRRAHLHPPDLGSAWTRWRVPWESPAPGEHHILVRATDTDGVTQPDVVPFNDGGYLFWAVVRHPVTVR